MNENGAPTKRGTGRQITSANARSMARKSGEARRRKREQAEAEAAERAVLARMSLTERLQYEANGRWADKLVAAVNAGLESEDQKERRATARLVLEWTAPKPAVRQEIGPIAAAQPSPEELARMTAELKEITAELDLP